MVFLAPINTLVFSIVTKQRRKVLQYSDLRVKMMNEILSGIRIIKFYAWERPFGKEVGRLRQKEMEALTKLAYTSAVGFSLILMSAPLIQPILVFFTYVAIQSEPLDAATAFTTVALFNIMRFPFAFLPMGMLQYIQSRISLTRLERYLDLPELGDYVVSESVLDDDTKSLVDDMEVLDVGSVSVRDGTFSWVDPNAKPIRAVNEVKPKKKSNRKSGSTDAGSNNLGGGSEHSSVSVASEASSKIPTLTLQNLTFNIEAGSLVAVVGAVGSGKSSLLSAIMGEMEAIHGSTVYCPRPDNAPGFVSYCAQTPWVVNDTLRGNVLFGRPYNEERYEEVIEACALLEDLAILPAGDATEIGERGINLSGGQKARVSLARAFYSPNTRIMLLDDPLSAVDAHVGEQIFTNAITGNISKGITRVLVTHHVHLLDRCDSVIVLEGGRIKNQGSYQQLIAQGVSFAGAIDASRAKQGTSVSEDDIVKQESGKKDEEVSDKVKQSLMKSGKKLVKEEEREEGSVDGSAYLRYAKAGGLWVAVWTFIIQGLGEIV